MPTLCVFNGNAIAGGYILGLCHDMRIMNAATPGVIALSELKLGLPIPYPYMDAIRARLDPIVCTKVCYGVTYK